MKNKKIIFWNLMKKSLNYVDDEAIYVLFGSNNIDLDRFKIKPILIKFHGALIIDSSNNKVVFSHELSKSKIDLIKCYASKYMVTCDYENNYEVKLSSENYYRMLVMPSFIKNEYNGIATYYNYPYTINKKIYQNYIVNEDVNILKSILSVIDYLNLESNDILDLINVCNLLKDVIVNQGYCMTDNKLEIKDKDFKEERGIIYEV